MRALTSIKLDGVSFAFGANTVLNQIDLHIDAGSIVALLGPSGCGKSTLLRLLAGLSVPASGSIHFGARLVAKAGWGMPPEQRDLGMVFQDYALWPHMTAAQNVAFPLRMRGIGHKERQRRVEEALAMVGLSGFAERKPSGLSGGQQQRVGVARALAADPQVLLMDEPFGALDPVTRGALQQEMTRIHRLLGRTIVLVTHDIDEALRLAEHLILMDAGKVVKQGTPLSMLTAPANDFVQTFFGRSELGVRLLSLRTVGDFIRRGEHSDGEPLVDEMTLRDALSVFVARGCDVLPVVTLQGLPCGTLHFRDLLSEMPTHETSC